mgnify:CR=1 FL=1
MLSSRVLLISDVLEKADEQPQWICNPYVVRRGITFLHGKTSIGKSPLSWELARTAAQGLDFIGWPTIASNVLYLEADGAEILLRSRLRCMPQPVGEWRIAFLAGESLNLCDPDHKMFKIFSTWRQQWEPDLVIWNTLRQFYKGNAIDSDTVGRVYSAMLRAFPFAGHWVSAHDRKINTDPSALNAADEEFAGSAAWRDLATVGLHLVKGGNKRVGATLTLEHTKSQVSELMEPVRLVLGEDGTTLTSALPTRAQIAALWEKCPEDQDRGTWTAHQLNISRRTLFRIKAT